MAAWSCPNSWLSLLLTELSVLVRMEQLLYLWKMLLPHQSERRASELQRHGPTRPYYNQWPFHGLPCTVRKSVFHFHRFAPPNLFSKKVARTWNVCPLYVNILSFSMQTLQTRASVGGLILLGVLVGPPRRPVNRRPAILLVGQYLICSDHNFQYDQYDDRYLQPQCSVSMMSASALAVSDITVSFRVKTSARSFNSYSSSSLA